MSRLPSLFVCLLLASATAPAQHHDGGGPAAKPAVLLPGNAFANHPIATSSSEAQKFFNQGLSMLFGFNRLEAVRSFQRASALDPKAAMPHWGLALARSQQINMDGDGDVDHVQCHQEVERARGSVGAMREPEHRYIDALAARCSPDPKADPDRLARAYIAAMRDLVERYPDDLDAAVLYGEALLVPHRWNWWSKDGKPNEFTEEAVAVLESVLRREPQHAGANHFHVHALEQSPHPERALPSAARLAAQPPATGPLVHMAGHIYLQTGDFDLASRTNNHAVEMDRGYLQLTGVTTGAYVLGYHPHNTHFIVVAEMSRGRFDDAWRAASDLARQASPAIAVMPEMADYFLPNQLFVLARFQKWNEILKTPEPDARLPFDRAVWRYARTLAFRALGPASDAAAERQRFEPARQAVPAAMMFGTTNKAQEVLNVAAAILDARLASNAEAALPHWRRAVETQDALNYDEPPAWYYPVRESLGGELLRAGRAAEAEAVFRDALSRHPRQGRLLFGLLESLQAQHKVADAEWVRREFGAAWKDAQVRLRVEDL